MGSGPDSWTSGTAITEMERLWGGGRSGGQTQSLGHVHFKMTVRHPLRCLGGSQRWVMEFRGEVWWAGQDRLRPPREKV